MKNEAVKTLISIPCVIAAGCVDILGTLCEMVYQIVKLLRWSFKLFQNAFLESIRPLYEDDWDYGIKKKNVGDEIKIYTFDYEVEEES